MACNKEEIKADIEFAINNFDSGDILKSAAYLLNIMGYKSNKSFKLEPNNADNFIRNFNVGNKFNINNGLINHCNSIDIVFQITEEEMLKYNQKFKAEKIGDVLINSYIFFAINLKQDNYSVWDYINITNEINKILSIPSFIIFKYGNCLAFSIADRRFNKFDNSKDVIEAVSFSKDINITNPKSHHIEFLYDVSAENVFNNYSIDNFWDLHKIWKTYIRKYFHKFYYDYEPEDYVDLGNYYFDREFYRSAIYYYSSAIDCDPGFEDAISYRGLSYLIIRDSESAAFDFEEVLKINPLNEIALNWLPCCYPENYEY